MILPLFYKDFYKTDHRRQYPKGTEVVYSNFTPRETRIEGVNEVVVFGIQYFIKDYLIRRFNEGFFSKPKEEVLKQYKRVMDKSLGPDSIDTSHLGALHDLGYLPIEIKALPEGSISKLRVPILTIKNTLPDFFWLTNFLETLLCNSIWHPITSATIAHEYRKMLDKYAAETSDLDWFPEWQGHDFSMRGHTSFESSVVSGMAHLTSFKGTDTIPAILALEHYYGANLDNEVIGGSVPATEHSVMCLGGEVSEYDTYHRLLTEIYPKGIVSVVSDTWDYWEVLTKVLPALKAVIMARDGKLVIRPDSGDPVKIVCGYVWEKVDDLEYETLVQLNDEVEAVECKGKFYFINRHAVSVMDVGFRPQEVLEAEVKGSIQLLWELFGGEVNSKGYKQLDSHIGLIYGDSITLDRCKAICEGLKKKGFASTNAVYGIGSYTYQYVTRDTFGFAMKATYGVINGKATEIFKKPKTDKGTKNSAKGLLCVNEDGSLIECATPEQEAGGLLRTVFKNGYLIKEYTLTEIRERLQK